MKNLFSKVVTAGIIIAMTNGIISKTYAQDNANDQSPVIRVMTFNLRYGTADDGNNSWPYRKDIAMQVINRYSPMLLGVQECLMGQADYIKEKAPALYYYGTGREENGFGEMEGIFFNKTLFTVVEAGTFWLSETPEIPGSKSWGAACTRAATWAKLRYLPTNTYFYWYNTHFDHISEAARQGAAKMLISKINEMTKGLPVLVTGDFNSPEGSAAWKEMTNGGFKDAWLEASQHKGPEVTFHSFMKKTKDEIEKGKDRIDWILIRGFKGVKSCETITYYENNGSYPSDHFPVYAELIL